MYGPEIGTADQKHMLDPMSVSIHATIKSHAALYLQAATSATETERLTSIQALSFSVKAVATWLKRIVDWSPESC